MLLTGESLQDWLLRVLGGSQQPQPQMPPQLEALMRAAQMGPADRLAAAPQGGPSRLQGGYGPVSALAQYGGGRAHPQAGIPYRPYFPQLGQ